MQSGEAWAVDMAVKAFRNMFCAAALFHFNFSEINFDNGSRCLSFGVFRNILLLGTGAFCFYLCGTAVAVMRFTTQ